MAHTLPARLGMEDAPQTADVELGFVEPCDGALHLDPSEVDDWDGGKVGGRPVSPLSSADVRESVAPLTPAPLPPPRRSGWTP